MTLYRKKQKPITSSYSLSNGLALHAAGKFPHGSDVISNNNS